MTCNRATRRRAGGDVLSLNFRIRSFQALYLAVNATLNSMRILLLLLVVFLSSCKALLLNAMLKDPKVETRGTISEFLDGNGFFSENTFVLKGDTSTVVDNIMMGLSGDYYVYDSSGGQLCYKGSSSCSGTQFLELLKSGMDSFQRCTIDGQHLDSVLSRISPLGGQDAAFSTLPQSDYYVVVYWQKFMGGKKGYKDAVQWLEKEAGSTGSRKVTFLKVNTDMQEEWGLPAGEKAKLRFRKRGSSITVNITNIPSR